VGEQARGAPSTTKTRRGGKGDRVRKRKDSNSKTKKGRKRGKGEGESGECAQGHMMSEGGGGEKGRGSLKRVCK